MYSQQTFLLRVSKEKGREVNHHGKSVQVAPAKEKNVVINGKRVKGKDSFTEEKEDKPRNSSKMMRIVALVATFGLPSFFAVFTLAYAGIGIYSYNEDLM